MRGPFSFRSPPPRRPHDTDILPRRRFGAEAALPPLPATCIGVMIERDSSAGVDGSTTSEYQVMTESNSDGENFSTGILITLSNFGSVKDRGSWKQPLAASSQPYRQMGAATASADPHITANPVGVRSRQAGRGKMEKGEGEERTELPELDYANQYAGPAAVEPTAAPASRAGGPASPRLEMSMRTPDRGFRRGDASGESEEEEEREAGACGRMMLAIHSAVSYYSYAWETLLRFCGIALAAYVGCFLRIACSRIRIMQADSGYTGQLVAQVVGCLLMGFVNKHTNYLTKNNPSLIRKVLFVSITSGLCGSITSFSGLNHICNKAFFLQWDLSWEGITWTYNASRFIDSLLCLWTGVAVPLGALTFGMYVAEFSPNCDKDKVSKGSVYAPASQDGDEMSCPTNGDGSRTGRQQHASAQNSEDGSDESVDEEAGIGSDYVACGCCGSNIDIASRHLELLLVFMFVLITFLIIGLAPTESQWIIAALSGAIGAYTRLGLSSFNTMREDFPVGTFGANIIGSWIHAAVIVLAKLGVDYNEQLTQKFLYGVAWGFCGCITTISTFAVEIKSLSTRNALVYASASFFAAQVGYILFLDAPAYAAVVPDSSLMGKMDMCSVQTSVCNDLLVRLQCSRNRSSNVACARLSSMMMWDNVSNVTVSGNASIPSGSNATNASIAGNMVEFEVVSIDSFDYQGRCTCDDYDLGSAVKRGIFNAEMKEGIERTKVKAWPRNSKEVSDPGSVVDLCVSHSRICSAWLDRTSCPWDQRRQNSCSGMTLENYVGECSCGEGNSSFGSEITSSIIAESLATEVEKFDTGLTACELVESRCNTVQAVVSCPASMRRFEGCGMDGMFVSWDHAVCGCGESLNLTAPVEHSILSGFLNGQMTIVPNLSGPAGNSVDVCKTFDLTCDALHRTMLCPDPIRSKNACSANGTYVGDCQCGDMVLGDWIGGQVAAAAAGKSLNSYAGQWSTVPPFTLVISSDPSIPVFEGD